MNIVTLKIKVDQEHRKIAVSDFFIPNSTLCSTSSKLVKEKNEYYWLVMIAYELDKPRIINQHTSTIHALYPEDYKKHISHYISTTSSQSSRTKKIMHSFIDYFDMIHSMEDFKGIRGLGKKTMTKDWDFFLGLFQLICKLRIVCQN